MDQRGVRGEADDLASSPSGGVGQGGEVSESGQTEVTARPEPRLSEGLLALRRKLLDFANAKIEKAGGLVVNVDGIGLEAIIAEAGVPRSSVYRIWHSREAFLVDLLCDLASHSARGSFALQQHTIVPVRNVLATNLDRLQTSEGRRSLLADAIRVGVEANFKALRHSVEWRSHVAMIASILSAPAEARERLEAAVISTERSLVERMAEFYADVTELLGFRIKYGLSFDHMVTLGAALIEGLCMRSVLSPTVVNTPVMVDEQPWHFASLSFMAIADQFLDLVPEDEYDAGRALSSYLARLAEREATQLHLRPSS